MKKIFSAVIVFLLLMANTVVFADNIPSVSINVKGNIEAGQNIQILINVSDVKNLYAGAAKLKYDKNILKVTGFEKGDLISKSGVNVFDVGNKIDNDNGIAEFGGFSCLGKVPGFSGSGTFIIIDAQVLKKDNFHVKSVPLLSDPNEDNNLKIQLVDNNAKDMNYNFTGYDLKVNSNGTTAVSQPKSEGGNTGNSGISTGSSKDVNTTLGKSASENSQQDSNGVSKIENSSSTANGNSNQNLTNSAADSNSQNKQSENDTKSSENSKSNQNKSETPKVGGNSRSTASSNKTVEAERKNNIYAIIGIVIAIILIVCFIIFKFILKKKRSSIDIQYHK